MGKQYAECGIVIEQAPDGGYVAVGLTCRGAFGGEWDCDIFVMKIDEEGNVEWAKAYGGDNGDFGEDVLVLNDGYLIAADSGTYNGVLLLKLDWEGNISWCKVYKWKEAHGLPNTKYCLQPTKYGGFILAGASTDEFSHVWVFVLNISADGSPIWCKWYKIDNNYYHWNPYILPKDNYYIMSVDGIYNFTLVKLNNDGEVVWAKSYGGNKIESVKCVCCASDGGYVMAGYTESFGAGGRDVWVVKTDSEGYIKFLNNSGAHIKNVTVKTKSINVSCYDIIPQVRDVSFKVTDTNITPYDTNATIEVQSFFCLITNTSQNQSIIPVNYQIIIFIISLTVIIIAGVWLWRIKVKKK